MTEVNMIFIVIIIAALGGALGSTWTYSGVNGPSYWSNSYSTCGESSQSPIDIVTDDAVMNEDLGKFTFSGYDSNVDISLLTLNNNGHSAQVDWSGSYPTVSDGGLSGTYNLVQFHLHWGSINSQGSEHTINSKVYAAELHLVHFKNTYADLTAAVTSGHSDAVAVIGVLIEESVSDGSHFSSIYGNLANIVSDSSSTIVASTFKLEDILPVQNDAYYRYSGSLTTPSCDQVVVWTVMRDAISMPTSIMTALRALQDSATANIEDNYRPVQSLNGRTVYASEAASAVTVVANISLLLTTLFLLKEYVC